MKILTHAVLSLLWFFCFLGLYFGLRKSITIETQKSKDETRSELENIFRAVAFIKVENMRAKIRLIKFDSPDSILVCLQRIESKLLECELDIRVLYESKK